MHEFEHDELGCLNVYNEIVYFIYEYHFWYKEFMLEMRDEYLLSIKRGKIRMNRNGK